MDSILVDSALVNSALIEGIQTGGINHPSSIWMWIAIIEFIMILILLILLLRRKTKTKVSIKEKINEGSDKEAIDFSNVIKSAFHATKLYDELKVKCHPDRFPADEQKNAIATELFQEITKNRTDLKKLTELKEKAKQELNINL